MKEEISLCRLGLGTTTLATYQAIFSDTFLVLLFLVLHICLDAHRMALYQVVPMTAENKKDAKTAVTVEFLIWILVP